MAPGQEGASSGGLGRIVPRRRLLDALRAGRIGVVEAGAGYGKSVLAAQYARALGVAGAFATVTAGAGDAPALLGALRRACRAARLSDLSTALEAAEDPATRLESLLDALAAASDPIILVIDDVHNLTDGTAPSLLVEVAESIPEPHRLLVTARQLRGPLDRLRAIRGAALIGAAELAFTPEEVASLFERRGVALAGETAHALREATAGWAAAVAMAAATTASAPDPALAAERLLELGSSTPARLLDELLTRLDSEDRARAVQLAHLPLLSPAVAEAVLGTAGWLERLAAAGIPLGRTPTGWWEMPGPVVDHLVGLAPLSSSVAIAAADVYHRLAEDRAALHTLMAAGETERAAGLLEQLSPPRVEELGPDEVAGVLQGLPAEAVAVHAGGLLHLARVAEATYHGAVRKQAIGQSLELARTGRLTAQLRNELDAERARDLLWNEDTRVQAETLAGVVIERALPDELVARARALDVLGRVRCWLLPRGSRLEAEPLLRQSVALSRRVGARTWAAQALVPLGWGVHSALCRYDRALATFDEALSELPIRNRYRAVVQSFRAEVLLELGRPIEAEAAIEEMREIGRAFGEKWALAFASWVEARLASYAGDRQRTVRAVVDVERHRDEWYDQIGGLEFLAHAGDLLDRVGEHRLALEYLERAGQRRDPVDRSLRLYRAMMAGRSGDPEVARGLIGEMLAREDLEPQEQWHLELLLAFAAHRAGDEQAGQLAAAALDRCLELATPASPTIREQAVTDALLAAAAAAGSTWAAQQLAGAGQLAITLFGEFELRRDGRRLTLPPGLPATAVRVVACAGGRLHAEQLAEQLWPRAQASAVGNRLRNLLSRLRSGVGEVLVREGEHIALAPGSDIDAVRFEVQGLEALALHAGGEGGRAASLARAALARYRVDLLPGDRYAPWAEAPRERLRALALELLDVAIDDAERREEIDEAVRLLQRAINAEPHDIARYVRLARLLASQGRAGSARATLQRARAALDELGVVPPAELEALERGL
jgi:ATP/maltotriose-dependent transcriptional regulator MalT